MRIALALPLSASAIGDVIRQHIPEVEIVREVPYANRSILDLLLKLQPDVVVVSEDLSCDEDLTLRQFVFGLREANIRVIFLAYDREPGDPLLSDLVSMGVTDLVTTGRVSVQMLREMFERQTPWSEVAKYVVPGRRPEIEPLETDQAQADAAAATPAAYQDGAASQLPPAAPAPSRGVTVVVGLGAPGTGVTTVAASLAALWGRASRHTALVDLDPVAPSIGIHLRIPLDYVALAQLGTVERAAAAAVEAHGIWIYNSPVYPAPPFAANMNETHVVRLMDALRQDHDRIVVDAGHRIDHPATRTVLQLADEIFIVADLDPYRTVMAVQRWPVLMHMTPPEKCRLIVNRVSPEIRHVDAGDVASAFDGPELAAELPLVPQAVDASIRGRPLALYLNAEHGFVTALQALVQPPVRRGGIRWPWRR